MSDINGTWDIQIATPMGTQKFTLNLAEDGGTLTGTATNNTGVMPVNGGTFNGETATFSVSVTAPFAIELSFTLTPDGDSISGSSKAGPFPASTVTGQRAQAA